MTVMHTRFAHTLLLILLLALTGQAQAASCGSDTGGGMSMPMEMDGDHQSHCAPGAGSDHGVRSGDCGGHDGDCEQNCGCCPGHCASALPAGDSRALPLRGNSQTTSYREFNSSPEPEAALRPPIRR